MINNQDTNSNFYCLKKLHFILMCLVYMGKQLSWQSDVQNGLDTDRNCNSSNAQGAVCRRFESYLLLQNRSLAVNILFKRVNLRCLSIAMYGWQSLAYCTGLLNRRPLTGPKVRILPRTPNIDAYKQQFNVEDNTIFLSQYCKARFKSVERTKRLDRLSQLNRICGIGVIGRRTGLG